jgi:hypothetical protein
MNNTTRWPVDSELEVYSCWKTHIPVTLSGSSPNGVYQWIKAHGYTLSWNVNEKNRRIWATCKPHIPGAEASFSMKMQSWRSANTSPLDHSSVKHIISWYSPPIPEGLLGAQKTAVTKWKTEILLRMTGQFGNFWWRPVVVWIYLSIDELSNKIYKASII